MASQIDNVTRFIVAIKRVLGIEVTMTGAFRSVNLDAD